MRVLGVNYVRVFSELPDARVVSVCATSDRNASRKSPDVFPGIQSRHNSTARCGQEGVDAVIVCTNATTHYGVAHRALMAGKQRARGEAADDGVSGSGAAKSSWQSRDRLCSWSGIRSCTTPGIHKMKE